MLLYKRPYLIFKNKLLVIKKYINKHLNKGFIYFNIFLITAPIFFAKKLKRGIQFCINYRGLNTIIIKTNTLYRLYIRLLSGLIKLKSILNLILLLPLTISKYKKVINEKLYLYHALVNLNILLCPLVYITAQISSKTILITPYRTTLITSTLCT